jgi:3-dehydroquinate synthase
MGLVAAVNLSARLGHCDGDLQATVETVLADADLPRRIPASLPPDKILAAMQHDKKKRGSRLRLILLKGIGDAFVAEGVPPAAISETLAAVTARV